MGCVCVFLWFSCVFVFKQKTAYDMRISDWSSDVCSSDLGVDEVSVVSETITTHEYESKTLAKAFTEITGIKVHHDLIQEGDVVEKLQTSMQSGKSIYDGWISDSDLIGTHYRYGNMLSLTDYMNGEGKQRSEEHTSELQSLMRISYAVFCLKKNNRNQ